MEVEMSHPLEAFFPETPKRERIPAEKRRTERIQVLVSQEERKILEALAVDRKCSVSKLLRSAIDVIPPPKLNLEGVEALHKISSQLAILIREVMGGSVGTEAVLRNTFAIHDECRRMVDTLYDRHSHLVP